MSKFKLAVPIIVATLMGLISYRWFGYSQSPQPSVRPIPAAPIAQLPFEIEIAILIAGNASAKLSESHTQDLPGLKPDCFLPDPQVTPRKIANGLISNSPTKKLGKGNTSGTGGTGILPVIAPVVSPELDSGGDF